MKKNDPEFIDMKNCYILLYNKLIPLKYFIIHSKKAYIIIG